MSNSNLSCPNCGAPIDAGAQDSAVICSFCGSDIRITSDGRAIPFFVREPQAQAETQEQSELDLVSIRRELAAGRKINAVKIVHEQMGITLKEAMAVVEEIEASLPAAQAPEAASTGTDLSEVRQLAQSGRKIEAIKRYRELMDTSLAEAKAAVEALESGAEPPAWTAPPAQRKDTSVNWPELLSMVKNGQKVEAARRYSDLTGTPMLESLKMIDRLEQNSSKGAGGAGWGCARLLLGIVLFFFLIFAGCGQFVRTTDLHACVIKQVSANGRIQDALGSPVEDTPLVFVLGYSSESDFGGRSERSAGYFMLVRGPEGRALLSVNAYENSTGFYGIEISPIPNPSDFSIRVSGDISDCLRMP